MQQDRVIGALIGLVGACNNNPKTEKTDLVVIKALTFPLLYPDCSDNDLQRMIDEIYAEKHTVAPSCAQCSMPCGNTSDYDMEQIYEAADDIRTVKTDIISALQKAAYSIYSRQEGGQRLDVDMEIFYKALSYISYDLERESFLPLFSEIQAINQTFIETKSKQGNCEEETYET